jgi:osmotically-inducible protein OsmY
MKAKTAIGAAFIAPLLAALIVLATVQSVKAEPDQMSDNAVKTVLEQRLTKYGLLQGNNIQVSVANGVITLTGMVRSLADKQRVARYAHQVDDTYNIEDQLTIQATDLSDQQIADSVMAQIDQYVFYSIFDWIQVQVNNGVATLSGWVDVPWHKQGYEKQAQKAPGVKQIISQIQVLPTSFSDDEIRRQAAEAIYDDGILYKYGYGNVPAIHIIVNMGIVTLEGVVNSSFDAKRAYSLVLFTSDAFDVVNQLRFPAPAK